MVQLLLTSRRMHGGNGLMSSSPPFKGCAATRAQRTWGMQLTARLVTPGTRQRAGGDRQRGWRETRTRGAGTATAVPVAGGSGAIATGTAAAAAAAAGAHAAVAGSTWVRDHGGAGRGVVLRLGGRACQLEPPARPRPRPSGPPLDLSDPSARGPGAPWGPWAWRLRGAPSRRRGWAPAPLHIGRHPTADRPPRGRSKQVAWAPALPSLPCRLVRVVVSPRRSDAGIQRQ